MADFEKLLSGDDLRMIGHSNKVVSKIKSQTDFDELVKFLFHRNRLVVMRAADAIEKITVVHPQYLDKHKKKIIELFYVAKNIELRWHLALIVSRLQMDKKDFEKAKNNLIKWANDKADSKLVRVGAIQGLFEMTKQNPDLLKDLELLMFKVEKENIPSINARIRNIRKEIA